MGIKIEKISGAIGAEISGIQIEDICKHDFKLVNNALLDHGVIYFRRQNITLSLIHISEPTRPC